MVGYLADETYRHNMYLIQKAMGDVPSRTLEEITMSEPSFPWHAHTLNRPVFTRRTRLHLAVKLACSVLYFHGNWLQTRRTTRDIRFPEGSVGFQSPFITWSVSDRQEKPLC